MTGWRIACAYWSTGGDRCGRAGLSLIAFMPWGISGESSKRRDPKETLRLRPTLPLWLPGQLYGFPAQPRLIYWPHQE
jgi:hypothetical protein